METALSVNLNKVALLRNARGHGVPSVTDAARAVLEAGAHGLTVHPRPDLRHIRPGDISGLQEIAASADVELNIEGNPFEGPNDSGFPGYMQLVEATRPAQATLVPDSPGQSTSDHGFDPVADLARLEPVITRLKGWGCRISVFVDPEPTQVAKFRDCGADRVEIYTGPYAEAAARGDLRAALDACVQTAAAAVNAGLGVNAGHDLDLQNLRPLKQAISNLDEVSIGHALTADALWMGWRETIGEYLAALATESQ